ncbi:MAG: phenylacetate-CoA oxygenase subunit PaaJ [Chitinophagaceae bacterium]|nr:MAG: phenylacetate-CoA oxygenase subunit PaaJ [Chitinophagaceae bacterium]
MVEREKILSILQSIPDPEIPVLAITDLGIIRNINIVSAGKSVEIEITPTYSGCPAMDMITMNIRMQLMKEGYKDVIITKVLAPAWTTDWMTENGRQKLKAYGIAPPGNSVSIDPSVLFAEEVKVQCPQCNSWNTQLISEFGSTSCKSLYRCNSCMEPFDHFKCH